MARAPRLTGETSSAPDRRRSLSDSPGDDWNGLGGSLFDDPEEARGAADEDSEASRSTGLCEDSLGLYLKQISRYPLLTAADERELARRVERGDRAARDRFIACNLRLVVSIAKRYQGMGLSLLDLIEEGNLGLFRAVDGFDISKGNRFSTYASKWIRQAVTRALANQSRTVRVPSNVVGLIRKYLSMDEDFYKSNGRSLAPHEVARRFRVSARRARDIVRLTQPTMSLDGSLGDGTDRSLLDVLPDEDTAETSASAFHFLNSVGLGRLLEHLDHRERLVLRLRFGLDDGDSLSLEETGRRMSVTRERARQIEHRALGKLRKIIAETEETRLAQSMAN